MSLNSTQLAAVRHTATPLLVVAGAGSGKTRVITEKAAHLVRQGVPAQRIAAVTFTNKAAREMRARVRQLLDSETANLLRICTFHALGLSILRAEHKQVSLRANFTIFDPADAAGRISELLVTEGLRGAEHAELIHRQLSSWKGQLATPDPGEMLELNSPIKLEGNNFFERYNQALRICNAVDLDDLIYVPVRLFQTDVDALQRWRANIEYLLVDEYQDTNTMQYMLVRQLIGDRNCLTAVGDDDQSIYSWRGAVPANMVRLSEDFDSLEVITLDQNYRSQGAILKAANLLIGNNHHVFEKKLWSGLGFGEPPRVMVCDDEAKEAEKVAYDLHHHRFMHGRRWSEYAILYRGNHQARHFERGLRALNIPYRVSGSTSFFALGEIRDVLAYLRVIANPKDDNAFLRIANVPRRGLGAGALEKLATLAAKKRCSLAEAGLDAGSGGHFKGSTQTAIIKLAEWLRTENKNQDSTQPSQIARTVIADVGYRGWLDSVAKDSPQAERRWRNVQDLVEWILQLERQHPPLTLARVLAELSLVDMLDDKDDSNEDCVRLMTLHAAKGLEFPYVYLVGMEEGLIPHRESLDDLRLEEERRLAYVGITRARESLCMTLARRRNRFGQVHEAQPSRFLAELEAADLRWDGEVKSPEHSQQVARSALDQMRAMFAKPD